MFVTRKRDMGLMHKGEVELATNQNSPTQESEETERWEWTVGGQESWGNEVAGVC